MKQLKKYYTSKSVSSDQSDFDMFENCISDLLVNNSVHSMVNYRHHAGVNCLEHSLYVAYLSFIICRFLGLDYKSAARGALLHDLFLYDWHTTKVYIHAFTHPYIALKNAAAICILNKKEKDVILKHMWPLTVVLPRCLEAVIVSAADKLCMFMELITSCSSLKPVYKNLFLKYSLNSV